MQDCSDAAAPAPLLAELHRLPEADDMRTACFAMCRHRRDLASAQRRLAAACRALAARLDAVHAEVIDELESLAEWSAGIQATGALFSTVTAGPAQVPTQAVQASRLAASAARVSRPIAGFVASARALTASIPTVTDLADAVALALRPLLGTRLAVAGVTPVRALPSVSRAARMEMAAEARLGAGSGAETELFVDRSAARAALTGDLRAVSNRFFRDASSKRTDYRISRLPHGGYRMEYYAPANNPGYGKIYVQVIDGAGTVLTEFRDTMGPAA